MEFSKTNLKDLRNDLEKALQEVATKHGISIGLGNMRFNSTECTGKITMLSNVKSTTDVAVEPRLVKFQADFLKNCMFLGLKATDLGRACKIGNEQFKIVGARARKNHVIVEDTNKKLWSYSPKMITLV